MTIHTTLTIDVHTLEGQEHINDIVELAHACDYLSELPEEDCPLLDALQAIFTNPEGPARLIRLDGSDGWSVA